MTTATTKLPTDARALIRDPDLSAAVEGMLEPYSGEKLERAQAAVRKVRGSGAVGTFSELVAAYSAAIKKAISEKDTKS